MARPRKSCSRATNNQALLSNGIALPTVGQDSGVAIMHCVTIYQVNRHSTPDLSYLDYETLATAEGIDNAEVPWRATARGSDLASPS